MARKWKKTVPLDKRDDMLRVTMKLNSSLYGKLNDLACRRRVGIGQVIREVLLGSDLLRESGHAHSEIRSGERKAAFRC